MLITIENVLNKTQVAQYRQLLSEAEWLDGAASAGGIAGQVKKNRQLDERTEVSQQLGNHIIQTLSSHPQFISAALPKQFYPPKFNAYSEGETYGYHIDGSIMQLPHSGQAMRTDVSATLFLSEPDEYEGGELCLRTQYGEQSVKLEAGSVVVYPSTSLHQVSPVTRGERIASFFWMQSMVRDAQQRELLYELDQSVQSLTLTLGAGHEEVSRLSGLYHNLMRQWSDT